MDVGVDEAGHQHALDLDVVPGRGLTVTQASDAAMLEGDPAVLDGRLRYRQHPAGAIRPHRLQGGTGRVGHDGKDSADGGG